VLRVLTDRSTSSAVRREHQEYELCLTVENLITTGRKRSICRPRFDLPAYNSS
jgi:hypothetical protein